VTGCQPIAAVEGVLARMQAGDILEWHRDAFHGVRRLAVVINLSEQPFEGGRFEMRRRESGTPLFAYDHAVPGSMMIFRLGIDLQHRVTPVTAGGPRVAFSGWLRAPIQPDEPRKLPNFSVLRG
jgi:Rps23 Pro-64 3,4-dihydroxylase Tpa1-like proline 4-hydroxylase